MVMEPANEELDIAGDRAIPAEDDISVRQFVAMHARRSLEIAPVSDRDETVGSRQHLVRVQHPAQLRIADVAADRTHHSPGVDRSSTISEFQLTMSKALTKTVVELKSL